MPKFSPLDINTFGDNSFQNHNRVQATVNTLGDNPPQVAEFTPVAQSANAQSYLNMIRQYSENGAFNPSVADATLYGDSKFASEVYKLNPQGAGFKEYNVGIDDLYTELNSGEMVAKYETYTPGIDNEEMLARNQGAAQVAMRGYKRFQNQVLTSFVGNLTAIPVGIFEWINTGNFEASYINGYTEWLDDLDTRSQLNNNIYYTQAEKDMSLGQSVFTSRFLFDKALGGAAFTVGMMLSEGAMAYATGGASLATTGARIGARIGTKIALKQAGKTAAKGLNRANTILAETAAAGNIGSKIAQKSGQWANYGSRTGKFINDARFVVTSSGYEAGMEARMFQKEAEESFYEYYKNLGIEPTAEDIREFRSNVYSEANKVFGANMGILGASNVALFGRMFGVGNPLKFISKPLNSIIDKKVFGIATKQVANGQFVAATRKTYQKILSAGWNGFVKPGFSEGVWEEGGQGIASEMMSNYMKSTYDHNAMREISGYTDSFYKAIDTQFTTKEGQESVLIGALIGTVFGGFGGSFTRASQMAKDQNRIAELETKVAQAPEQITKALYSKENFLSQVGNLSRIMNLEDSVQESERKGEIAEASLKTTAMIISSLQAAFQVGKDGSFLKVLVGSIQGVDNKTIMEQYNLNTVEEAAAFKADRVAAVNQIAEWYEHNANLSDTFIGEGRLPKTMRGKEQLIKDALAFSLTMSQVSEKIAVDAISTIKDVYSRLGDTTSENVADIIGIFSLSDPEIIKSYNEAKEQYRIQEEEVRKKVKELQTEQTKPESIRSVEELTRLGEELAAAEEKFATISSTYNGIKATMENRYFEKIDNTGIGSIVDFENLNTSLDKTRTALDALEKVHPEAHARLSTAFDTLQKATTYSQEFSDIYKGLLDPKFNTRVANGIFSGRVANKRSLNEVTEETLNRILMAGVKLDNEGNITPTITTLTQDVFDEFKKTGEVGTEVLDEIAIKLFEKQDLTPQEQEVYNAKKSEIDSIVKEIVKAEVVTKLQNDESLSQEEQRIYEEFKDEIDDILDDPLNNATGEEINEQQDIPELSEELRAQFDEHENKRQEELKGLNEEDAEVINELFDEMYEYSVAKGEITAEQALKELEKIGQEGSKSYNKINTLSLKGRAVRLRALREKLKEIISNSKVIQKYFENKESINIRNISDEEIKRFYELRDKRNSKSSLKDTESDRLKELQNKTDLSDEEFLEKEKLVLKSERGGMTSEEFSEMEELENRLFEYNVLQGTVFEGASLLELLKLYHQTNKDIENIDVNKDSHTEEEYVEIALTEEKEGGVPPERREAISQITEYGLLKYIKGSALISHIQLSDLIGRAIKTLGGITTGNNSWVDAYVDRAIERYRKRAASEGRPENPAVIAVYESWKTKRMDVSTYTYMLGEEYNNLRVGDYSSSPTPLDIEKYTSQVTPLLKRVDNQGGWHYRMPHTGTSANKSDKRISLNVRGDERLIDVLDKIASDYGVYYKTPQEKNGWDTRHDPVTIYLNNPNLTEDQLTEIKERVVRETAPYIRSNEGFGEYGDNISEGVEYGEEATAEKAQEIIKRAGLINSDIAEAIRGFLTKVGATEPVGSVGQQIAASRLLDIIEANPSSGVSGIKIKVNGVEVNDDFEKYNAIDGTVVEIEISPTEVYELRIESKATKGGKAPSGKRIGVPIELKADNPKETLRDVFGITTPSIAGQRGGYYLAYEEVGGVSRPIKATEEFTIKNDSGLVYDPIETRRLKSGDEVELVYDATDYYNKTLDKKSIIKEANIYIVKNGKIVGRLKSADKVKDSNLYNIRKSVVEAEGKITIEVSAVLSGLPIIQTEQGGGKKLIPVNNNDIVAQGYIQDGQIVGDMPDEVSKRFIVAASNNSPGMRVPFVVVKDKISGANVAFPVEIEPIGNIDALFAFDDVLQNDSLSDSEKALLLNEILIENGVSLEDYWLTPEIIEDNAYIGEVREAVSQTQSTLDLDDFASGEKYNVLTVINFENEAFTAPKVVLDFDSVKESGEKKKPTPTSKEEEEERMREVIKKVAEKISVITYKVKGLTRRIVFKSEIDKNLMRYKSRGVTAEENEKIFQYLSKTFPKVGNRNMTVTDINEVARDFRREVKKRIEEAEQGRTNFTFEAIHSEITAEFIRRKKLPPSLRTATQEFSPLIEGNNRTRTISFESPLDKALFIVANVGRKATDYNSVAKWLKDNYNLTLPQAIKMGLKVRKKAKESVDAQEDGVVAIEEIVKISPKEEDDSEQIIGLIRENYVKATIRNSQGRFENVVGVFLKDEGVIVVGDKVIEAGKVKSFKPVNVKITPALVKQVRKALEEC